MTRSFVDTIINGSVAEVLTMIENLEEDYDFNKKQLFTIALVDARHHKVKKAIALIEGGFEITLHTPSRNTPDNVVQYVPISLQLWAKETLWSIKAVKKILLEQKIDPDCIDLICQYHIVETDITKLCQWDYIDLRI